MTTTTPISNVTAHWANTSYEYTAFGVNVIDNGHGSNSKIFRLEVNGNEVFSIDNLGNITSNNTIYYSNNTVSESLVINYLNSLPNTLPATAGQYWWDGNILAKS